MKIERRRFLRTTLGASLAAGLLPRCGPGATPSDAGADLAQPDATGADSEADAASDSGVDAIAQDTGALADGGCLARASEFGPGTGLFRHGVASGDPLTDAVILWTRVTPPAGVASVEVTYELSTERTFATIARAGTLSTTASRDFTVKVDANGLTAGRTYFYRFRAMGETSPIGRTRTAPEGDVSRLRLALVSCSSYGHGYFHGYKALSRRADLDAVVHLGDYIYEYATALDAPCFGGTYGSVRPYDPPHEIKTLEDYRRRYAHYRRDPDLQDAHRQHPFIAIWDDHEFADNAHPAGAENHSASEGDWAARVQAAMQAYREWMPIREQMDGRIYRRMRFGSLVDLVLLDTRMAGRDPQIDRPSSPERTNAMRQLLGAQQEAWLATQIADAGARWKLLGQQVMMSDAFAVFPNVDQWDGYPAARQRFFEMLARSSARDVVVLTGDIHSSWAWSVVPDGATFEPTTGAGAVAVEFVVPAVTSPGFPAAVGPSFAAELRMTKRNLSYVELVKRGYVVLDITDARVEAAWFLFDRIDTPTAQTERVSAVRSVDRGSSRLREVTTPAEPRADAPPLAP
ncbi:MAG: alkaline phosphatase D family protein [Myxococcales bacterium]|nr:alkaline phosphatase D family protein [Myxococcales bacterium]